MASTLVLTYDGRNIKKSIDHPSESEVTSNRMKCQKTLKFIKLTIYAKVAIIELLKYIELLIKHRMEEI